MLPIMLGADPTPVAVDPSKVTAALASFSVDNLMTVITAGLGIAVPLVLAWFGFRWIYKKAKGALKRGV